MADISGFIAHSSLMSVEGVVAGDGQRLSGAAQSAAKISGCHHARRSALRRNSRPRTRTDRTGTRAAKTIRRQDAFRRSRVQALRHLRLSARSDRGRPARRRNRRRYQNLRPPDGRAARTRPRRRARKTAAHPNSRSPRAQPRASSGTIATTPSPKFSRRAQAMEIRLRSSSPRRPSIPKAADNPATAA